MKAGPFSEVGGVAADVDGYIPYMAGEDADELSLRLAKLVVETSEDAPGGKGLIVLNELSGEVGVAEGILVENFSEPSTVVAKALGLNEFDIGKRGVENEHPSSLPVRRGSWKSLNLLPEMERAKAIWLRI